MTGRWPGDRAEVEEREDELEVEDDRLEEEEHVHELPLEEEPIVEEDEAAPVNAAEAEAEEAEEEPEPIPELRAAAAAEHAGGELDIPDEVTLLEGVADGKRRSVAIVAARFNGEITNRLLQSALDELEDAGVRLESVTVMPVPGAFELPLAAMAFAKTRRYGCVVALGCVIRGDTPHFEYVAGEAASGLQLAALETGVPVAFGVLTCDTPEQAEARVDKGAEAVRTALEMADLFAQLRTSVAAAAK
jgi:6,7-dimethyl-8-ribityllumazine synthase